GLSMGIESAKTADDVTVSVSDSSRMPRHGRTRLVASALDARRSQGDVAVFRVRRIPGRAAARSFGARQPGIAAGSRDAPYPQSHAGSLGWPSTAWRVG